MRSLALALVVWALLPATASAHAMLEATVPARGATLAARVISAGGGAHAGRVTGAALDGAHAVQYAAIALGLGALIFFVAVWHPSRATSDAFATRLERIVLGAALAGAVSAIAALVLQGAVGDGSSFWSAATPGTVGEVLGTRFGRAWGAGAVLWLVAALLVATLRPFRAVDPPARVLVPVGGPAPRPARVPPRAGAPATASWVAPPRVIALAAPLVALALLPALGGHASVQSPVALLLPANVAHVLAMSAWLGGVAVLVLALRSATAELAPGERTPLLADVVGRFSALATIALPLLLLSGLVQAIVEVRSIPALFDTAFGRSVLLKATIALGIAALGFINRQERLPELRRAAIDGTPPGRTGLLLRRTLGFELALGLAAIAVTGALSGYPPSVAAAPPRASYEANPNWSVKVITRNGKAGDTLSAARRASGRGSGAAA